MRKLELTPLILDNPFPDARIPERMVWTSSSLKQFRKDKRKWFWRYIYRLRARGIDKNLMIGTHFHAALGQWYRGRRSNMRCIVEPLVVKMRKDAEANAVHFSQDDADETEFAIDRFMGMMLGYGEVYKSDRRDWCIEPASVEAQFKVDMGDFDYCGKIDLIAVNQQGRGYRFLAEHKTASSIDESYIERLPLDTQVRGYVFGAREGLGYKPTHVLYDVCRKSKLRRKSNESVDSFSARIKEDYLSRPDWYFYREPLSYSMGDIAAFEHEVRQTHAEYTALIKECSSKEGKVINGRAIFGALNPRSWAPNDEMCRQYYHKCEYSVLCREGLDPGTARFYTQIDDLNEELSEIE